MKVDRQDVLLVLGVVSLIGGLGCWSRPLAMVVFGMFCLFSVFLIERAEGAKKEKK